MKQAQSTTRPATRTPRKRGRPDPAAGEEALNTLYRVAYTHFIVNGVDDASMLAIAREAGVSRQMIHNRFGNKQQFFDAVVQHGDQHMQARFNLETLPTTTDPWIVFNALGNGICNVVLDPDGIGVFRVMNVAAYRHPEIAATHEMSLNKAYALFTRFLRAAGKTLNVEIDDPKGASRDFLSLINGYTLPTIQGRRARPTAQVQAKEIKAIVSRFLRGLGFDESKK